MKNKEKKAKGYVSKTIEAVLNQISPQEQKRTEQRMLLAARIADAIDGKGWSQKEFAARLDKHPSEITKWLSGTHNFTSDTLFDIQEVLGIKLIELAQALSKGQVVEIKIAIAGPPSWHRFLYQDCDNLLVGKSTFFKSRLMTKTEAYA